LQVIIYAPKPLGVLLKNPCSRYVVGNRFLWLRREQERRQKRRGACQRSRQRTLFQKMGSDQQFRRLLLAV
jgi:hypothetical protein